MPADAEYHGEDWYAEDLGDQVWERCVFVDIDLTEVRTRGARFSECRFDNCRLNASQHVSSAFVACEFRRSNLFDTTFEDCQMSGSIVRRLHRCGPSPSAGARGQG